ncbi:MAG: hypothetical protein R6V14_07240 [Halanaerobiales bacterium]
MNKDLVSNMRYVLSKAKNAHHKYEQNELDGRFDKEWYKWYAGFILNSNVRMKLSKDITEEEMIGFLKEITDDYTENEVEEDWEDYAAERLIKNFAE